MADKMVVVMFRFKDDRIDKVNTGDAFQEWANSRIGMAYRTGQWDGIEMKAEVVDAE